MSNQRKQPELKPLLAERLKLLMPNEKDFTAFLEILKQPTQNSIRCNTLKITPNELIKRLDSKGWKIEQPFSQYPEIMIIKGKFANNNDNINNGVSSFNNHINKRANGVSEPNIIDLEPGELGRSLEHLLGYYYVQEIASMLPVLTLKPKPNELVLDLAAAPGSKTTQIASEMQNTGTIIANDVNIGRISILATNLERCGVSNTIVTRKQGFDLCRKLNQQGFLFDKILLDAPCSGEGTLRSSRATYEMWNIKSVNNLSNIQKSLIASCIDLLKLNGELVYSTCTHSPEENEEVIDFALEKFGNKIKVETIKLPVKCRIGLTEWNNKEYNKSVEKACRIYPQDNDTEGFFVAKLRRIR
ncbi:MAG: RsmB/NOP family class I SAM-dependent RNA methyltransferase [Candidatus Pacearchaeota archaeon]